MLRDRSIVVFSDDWGRHPSSCQHLFRKIAPFNRVLWVETIGLRRPRLTAYDLRRVGEKLRGWIAPKLGRVAGAGFAKGGERPWCEQPPTLVRYSPPMHPFYGNRPGAAANDVLLRRLVRRKIESLRMDRPLLVTTVPNAVGLVGHLGERASVYYCVDDFEAWPGYEATAIRAMENELVGKVDALVATAVELERKRARPGLRTMVLPHGVDVAMFAKGGPEPFELRGFARPRVLSLGLFDERIDAGLVAAVARQRPSWSFLFVGPRTAPRGPLDDLPNVHVLPKIGYREVPAWLANVDVLVIPYVRNAQTDTINPLKLRELLASGTPVAATALPEIVRAGGDLVPTGDDPESFARALDRALAARDDAAVRRALVAKDDWAERAEAFCAFLEPLFGDPPILPR